MLVDVNRVKKITDKQDEQSLPFIEE